MLRSVPKIKEVATILSNRAPPLSECEDLLRPPRSVHPVPSLAAMSAAGSRLRSYEFGWIESAVRVKKWTKLRHLKSKAEGKQDAIDEKAVTQFIILLQ